MFVEPFRNYSFVAALLAITTALTLVTAPGCRSVVDGSRDLTELAAASREPQQEKSSQASAASPRPSEKTPPEKNPAVEAAEVVLTASVVQTSEKALRPQHVESRGWYLDHGVPVYEAIAQRSTRWRHPALESLLDQPESPQSTLEHGIQSTDPEIVATAFIGLVRSGFHVEPKRLAALIERQEIAFTTQAALLEALATTSPKQSRPLIERLFEDRMAVLDAAQAQDEELAFALRQQYWISLAWVLPEQEQITRFTQQFSHSSPEMQSTLLDLLMFHRSDEQDEITDYFEQLSPQAIRRVGLWEPYLRSVAPLETLIAQTRSPEFASRSNATLGLGRDGSIAAQEMLKQITDKDPTLVQVAAVFAWSLVPNNDQWTRLSEASSWRVRLAVAQLVPLQAKYQDVFARLKEDNSRQVREAMIERSPELVAQKITPAEAPQMVRPREIPTLTADEAVAMLDLIEQAEHATNETVRTEARRALLLKPESVLAAVDQVAKPLVAYENRYLFEVLLPQCDPAYRYLQEATSGDPKLTLAALRKLEEMSRQAPLPELVVWRLQSHVEHFTRMTWPVLMDVIRSDRREAAQQIVRRAMAHDDPHIRIAAYRYIADFPMQDVTSQVRDGLHHEVPNVRLAAIEALAAVEETSAVNDFVGRLTDSDVDVQMAACLALDACGDARGLDHLSRLTYSSSKAVRLKAVQAIAARKQASDIPILIRMLDDETSIRSAAIEGLSSIVPHDERPMAVSEAISPEAKCAAWKSWFNRKQGLGDLEFLSPAG